jgi:hypothetical protein
MVPTWFSGGSYVVLSNLYLAVSGSRVRGSYFVLNGSYLVLSGSYLALNVRRGGFYLV